MPVGDEYLNYVLERLGVTGPVTAKRMFGGAGVYSGSVCFALVADDVLYLKVDDSNRGEFEAAGRGAFSPFGTYSMSYFELPADVLEDDGRLKAWAGRAIAAATRGAGKKGAGRGG
jgi:DNA transformation protein